MAEAQADLAAAENILENKRIEIQQKEISYKFAKAQFDRYKQFRMQKVISEREFLTVENTMHEAATAVELAKCGHKNAQSSINRIKARIALIQAEMDNMLTTAAFDGRILQVINRGRVLKTGDKIADAADFSQIYMDAVIPECAAKKLHPDREVTAILDILPQVTIPGKITSITPDGEFCCIRTVLDAAALKSYTGMLHTGLKGEIWVKITIK